MCDRGLHIPQDLGVAGYDNISFAEFSAPRLTTVKQDVEQKAKLAVKILMDRIQGRETEEERDIRLPVTLITRKSVMVQEREK